MNGAKQPRWLIGAVLVGLALVALVIFRPRPAPTAQMPPAPARANPTTAQAPVRVNPTTAPTAAAQPALAAALDTAPALTSTSGPNDWAMEGSNPGRTRAITTEIALPFTQKRALALAGDTGTGSPLTIAHGMLLVESPHQLRALDLNSGNERWSLPLDGVYVSPAVAGDTVFVRSEADNKGQLLALDIRGGTLRWAFRPRRLSSADTGYFGGHLTSPVVVGGMVFLGAGQEVYALDATTGAQRWEFSARDLISSSATVAHGHVYIADFKNLYAIDQQTGKLIWVYPTTLSIYFSPVAAGDIVLLTNGDELVALDAASGKQRWVLQIAGEGLIPGAVQGDRAFVKSRSTLYALNLATGQELWRSHDLNFISLPVVAGDRVFFVSGLGADTTIAALDAASGRDAWRQPVALLSTSAPVIAGQSLYVRTTDGHVIGFGR